MTKSTKKQTRKFAQHLNGPSVTQQHFKEECDINNIVARYTQTGIDPFPDRKARETFGFATSKDFAESAYAVAEIRSAFAALPSSERSAHNNDPETWIKSMEQTPPPEEEITPPEPPQAPPPPEDSTLINWKRDYI